MKPIITVPIDVPKKLRLDEPKSKKKKRPSKWEKAANERSEAEFAVRKSKFPIDIRIRKTA